MQILKRIWGGREVKNTSDAKWASQSYVARRPCVLYNFNSIFEGYQICIVIIRFLTWLFGFEFPLVHFWPHAVNLMGICWGPELISDYPFLPPAIVSQVEINSRPSKLSRFFKGIGLDDAASPLAANSAEKKWTLEKSVSFKSWC